jgi:hypothetical protein
MDGRSIVERASLGYPIRPAHVPKRFLALEQAEVQFLEYRLDVVASWPDSGRKKAAMNAIYLRLKSFADIPLK